MYVHSLCVFILVVFMVLTDHRCICARAPTEVERVKEWHAKNNTWPPNWSNETPQFKRAMAQREQELQFIPGRNERWENYMQYTQSRLVPRFTELGFEVVSTPPEVQAKLKAAVDQGVENFDNLREERQIDAVFTPIPSKFVNMRGVDQQVLKDLLPHHEQWSGMKLRGTSAYGTRLYRNGSSLAMHYDKTNTHVISSIVHIAHEYDDDDEPWPIEIEDHYGNIHAVNLEPGQMLFYESAACVHGRRTIFKGRYYGSIFLHYQPVDKTIWDYDLDDIIAAVPPHWSDGTIEATGSRWSGQTITTDTMVTAGANERIVEGVVVPDIKAFYQRRMPAHYAKVMHALAAALEQVEEDVAEEEETTAAGSGRGDEL